MVASITAERGGVLSGMGVAKKRAEEIGLEVLEILAEGDGVSPHTEVMRLKGSPLQIARAEDVLIGLISKASGIATAARRAVGLAGTGLRVVSGGWKKMPESIKGLLREAVATGGAGVRLCEVPFLYLDKNYIRIFGGVREALDTARAFRERLKVVQVRGERGRIAEEALEAAEAGADMVMVDTGSLEDLEAVGRALREGGAREKVKVAFGGGVELEGLAELSRRDVDVVDIGAAIVDAPLLPFKFDVVFVGPIEEAGPEDLQMNLLNKREVWVEGIRLEDVDLTLVADAAAEAFGLKSSEVLVTDAQEETLTLDILKPSLNAGRFAGREKDLLAAMGGVPGVSLTPRARVHSDGVLGMISMGKEEARSLMQKTRDMARDISRRVASRALIFPTGGEVRAGLIKDLNTGFIASRLRGGGYTVKVAEALEDDDLVIARAIQGAIDEGYGLLITTGGVGAEDKDRTVEGILRVIPEAATPHIIRFTRGTGRHAKDGVRIAVGRAGATLVVALPGPHDEVRESVEVLLKGLKKGLSPSVLAFELAEGLRGRLGSLIRGLPHPPKDETLEEV